MWACGVRMRVGVVEIGVCGVALGGCVRVWCEGGGVFIVWVGVV